jgi:uncharacterized membrane protein
MKWYSAIITRILKGIIFFLLPIILLLYIFEKALKIIQAIILPLKTYLPDSDVFGIGLLSLISIALILLICYLAGILAERKYIKAFITLVEDKLLIFIPGYALMKSGASETIGKTDDEWSVVLIGEDDEWKFGIEVEHQADGFCTVFFPEPPDGKSGEIKLVHASKLKRPKVSVSEALNIARKYGQGAQNLLK